MGYFGEDEEDVPLDDWDVPSPDTEPAPVPEDPEPYKLKRRNRGPAGLELRVQALEDEILEGNLKILKGVSLFGHPNAQDAEPPKEWIEEYGEAGAREMQLYAKLAMAPASQAPIAFQMSRQTAMGILANRAKQKSAPVHLHLNVSMVMPPPTNQRRVIDTDGSSS